MESNVADEYVLLVLGLHGGIPWSSSCNVSGYVTIKGSAKREPKKLELLDRYVTTIEVLSSTPFYIHYITYLNKAPVSTK